MFVRIYKQQNSVTQSGLSLNDKWVLIPIETKASLPDSMMGWHGRGDLMAKQIKLFFASSKDAIAYCIKEKHSWILEDETSEPEKPKSYQNNFKSTKRQVWSI